MNILKILFLSAFFLSSPAFADLYQWTDKEGVLHIADDIGKVPKQYRESVKVLKTKPAEKILPEPERKPSPPAVEHKKEEVYGDYPLDWWMEAFKKKKEEIKSLEAAIAAKKQYIDVFEGGRRFGQTFGTAEVETYTKYKKEVPEDESMVKKLKEEVEELRRKAALYGVPKEIRE